MCTLISPEVSISATSMARLIPAFFSSVNDSQKFIAY